MIILSSFHSSKFPSCGPFIEHTRRSEDGEGVSEGAWCWERRVCQGRRQSTSTTITTSKMGGFTPHTHTHISGKISIPLSLEGNSNIHRVHLTFFPALCYAGAHKFRVVKVTIVVSVTHPKSTIKDILEFFIVINLADFIRICVCGAQNKHTI